MIVIKDFLKRNKITSKYYIMLRKMRQRYYIHKNGLGDLGKFTNKLNSQGIITFADFGTLLGLVREGQLLKHDLDIDVGVFGKDNDTSMKVEECFLEEGYYKAREFEINNRIAEQSYKKKGTKIDIQYYFSDDNKDMFCYLFYNQDAIKKGYWSTVIKKCPIINEVKTICVNKNEIYIPVNANEVLEYKYGPNWDKPDKGWVYWEGPNTYKIDELGHLDFHY